MSESYCVRLSKDYLVFSAAHFITYNGNVCERLHGHNYRVDAEIAAPLDENHYVIDFIALRDNLYAIAQELDHHMLLPTEHRSIKVTAGESEVEVKFEDRRWVFPRGDCRLLPIPNTTAELLARHIGQCLIRRMGLGDSISIDRLMVGVDENDGQWGRWHWERPAQLAPARLGLPGTRMANE